VPFEPGKAGDRVTLAALKGAPVRLATYPWVDGKSEEEIAARLAPGPAAGTPAAPGPPAPSLDPDRGVTRWIARLFQHPALLRMGHDQRAEDRNLGLGWLYYALGRIVRSRHALVIGSYRGFVPLVLAKALGDNLEGGTVTFLDPSLVDDFWTDPAAVRRHFAGLGVENVRHFPMTTQAFVETEAYRRLAPIGLLFIDGYHSEAQARFDYAAFEKLLEPRGLVLFHDSMLVRRSEIYGPDRAYETRVRDFVDTLKRDPALQVLDLPFGSGLTLLRRIGAAPRLDGPEGRP
jgi:predicted O-methyltransferase YrrM